jgi:hypothetical protein
MITIKAKKIIIKLELKEGKYFLVSLFHQYTLGNIPNAKSFERINLQYVNAMK